MKLKLTTQIINHITHLEEYRNLLALDETLKGKSENEFSEETQQKINKTREALCVKIREITPDTKKRLYSVYNRRRGGKTFLAALIVRLERIFPPNHSEFFIALIKKEFEEFVFNQSLKY
jgi:predicted  nucleic acid-binding Zn-ribbon protein